MKEINNIETNRPLNDWLYDESDNGNILVILRNEKKHNYYTYKVNLNKELKVPEITKNNHFDIMEIWDIEDLSDTKLLWQRGELLSKEDFMKEYEKVFDNNVDWENTGKYKYNVMYDYRRSGNLVIGSFNHCRAPFASYTNDEEKAEKFSENYEQEIRKYLFGLEVE